LKLSSTKIFAGVTGKRAAIGALADIEAIVAGETGINVV
jgi:carbamate kinase